MLNKTVIIGKFLSSSKQGGTQKKHYSVLNVESNVVEEEIEKAYHNLFSQYYPYKDLYSETEESLREVEEAYKVLSNIDKRKLYDSLDDSQWQELTFEFGSTLEKASDTEIKDLLRKYKEINSSDRHQRLLKAYFSLLVRTPSGSLTILRCVAHQEVARQLLSKSVEDGDVLELRGCLRNEWSERQSRQIIVKVIQFKKLDVNFDSLNVDRVNCFSLLGEITKVLNLENSNSEKKEITSFKVWVPQKESGNISETYFCRISNELLQKLSEQNLFLEKGTIVMLEGFLQTKKVKRNDYHSNRTENEMMKPLTSEQHSENSDFSRVSSLICCSIMVLGQSSGVSEISTISDRKLTVFTLPIRKIDFTKPKTTST